MTRSPNRSRRARTSGSRLSSAAGSGARKAASAPGSTAWSGRRRPPPAARRRPRGARRPPRQSGRHGRRESRPADPRQRRPRQHLRQRLAHRGERSAAPAPTAAPGRRAAPPTRPKPGRRGIGLGRHAGAEAGQSIERGRQGRRVGRRVRIEEEGLRGQPVRRPERHPGPDAQLERRPARVQDRAVRPRPAAQDHRLRLRMARRPCCGPGG